MDRYKDMTLYICKHGHEKYVRKDVSPTICNLCGTKEFKLLVPEEDTHEK
jgi:hypothetical protein